jgi:hypothetical protein
VRAGDREGLERLCRTCARPPFRLERLSMLADGRVAYLRCMPRRNGATHLVMTPVQLLARLAALIPPPRFPWQRLSGVSAGEGRVGRERGGVVLEAAHHEPAAHQALVREATRVGGHLHLAVMDENDDRRSGCQPGDRRVDAERQAHQAARTTILGSLAFGH